MEFAHETIDKMQSLNRRSIDPLAVKIWFAVERTYELVGELAGARPSVSSIYPIVHLLIYFSTFSGFSWLPNERRPFSTMTMRKRH
jgi:hypothetical protein